MQHRTYGYKLKPVWFQCSFRQGWLAGWLAGCLGKLLGVGSTGREASSKWIARGRCQGRLYPVPPGYVAACISNGRSLLYLACMCGQAVGHASAATVRLGAGQVPATRVPRRSHSGRRTLAGALQALQTLSRDYSSGKNGCF